MFPEGKNNIMPTAETLILPDRELIFLTPGVRRVIAPRHGEPIDRFGDTKLSAKGEKEFEGFMGSYLAKLDERRGRPLVVLVGDTGFERTIQCGEMAFLMAGAWAYDRGAKNWLTVVYLGENKALRPNGAFKPLMEAGVPHDKVAETFFTSSDEENQRKGALPKEVIVRTFEQQLLKKLQEYAEYFPGVDIDFIIPNHEANLGSIVQTYFPEDDWHIKPAEDVTIEFKQDGVKYSFRGKSRFRPFVAPKSRYMILASNNSEASSITY